MTGACPKNCPTIGLSAKWKWPLALNYWCNSLFILYNEAGVIIMGEVLKQPVSLEEEFEDLIVRELEHESYSKDQIVEMLPEKKKSLSKAIMEELKSRKKEDTLTHEEIIKELE